MENLKNLSSRQEDDKRNFCTLNKRECRILFVILSDDDKFFKFSIMCKILRLIIIILFALIYNKVKSGEEWVKR